MIIDQNKIRIRIILPFSAVMAVIFIIFAIGAYRIQQYHLNQQVDSKLKEVRLLFDHLIKNESKFIKGQLNFIAKDPGLMGLWQNRDREKLFELASPIFEDIRRKFGITHFYFIDPDKTCFLRVHKPDRYGDTIRRRTLQEAAKTVSLSYGIELGVFGTFTLRVIYPYMRNGKLAGYLELGEEIEHLTPYIKELSGLDLIFTINKSELERKNWEIGVNFLNKNDTWDDFKPFVVIDKTVPDISPRLRIAIEKACQTNKLPPKNIFIGDYIFRIASVPLTDFSKKNVGNLLAVYDITEKIRALKITLLKTFCAILFVISVLFVFFYRYSGRIEKQLLSFHNQLENIVKYRTRELQQALDEVKTLRGFLPICSYCKKIRDDKGYWNQIEAYISEHSEVQFSHGICTECMKKHYPEIHVKESASEK